MTSLYWLPEIADRRQRIHGLKSNSRDPWETALTLARSRLDFLLTNALDDAAHRYLPEPREALSLKPVRLAILSSSTVSHLLGAIRVAGLRHNLWVETYECAFGQYFQELSDPTSALHAFGPTAVLVALDGYYLAGGAGAELDSDGADNALKEMEKHIRTIWQLTRSAFQCTILQQTAMPVHFPVLGHNEHRLPGSRQWFLDRLNFNLRVLADTDGVHLIAIDSKVSQTGIAAWHDHSLWHRAKQEVAPQAAPLYGELVIRLLAATVGRVSKCLVLDLDNTLWGGVIGDDGVEGIVLGQGSPAGEAFVAFQQFTQQLCRRGVILAVCSKNELSTAISAFEQHPEMVLKRSDIACFAANWSDKPDNIRAIAEELNIGLDALVFVDDNPFERDLVRRELPMVAVPEVGDDPVTYGKTVADAGYFEALSVTDEDRARAGLYRANLDREAARTSATNLDSYLSGLQMRLIWKKFDDVAIQRIAQLINKSNQFNLTTRRYTAEKIRSLMKDPAAFGLQLRLIDNFGDNGIVAIVIGRLSHTSEVVLDTWLMSCRVLGRQVEQATLNVVADFARRIGARCLIGEYFPTQKNGMVKDHYSRLGFQTLSLDESGKYRGVLDLSTFIPYTTFIEVMEN